MDLSKTPLIEMKDGKPILKPQRDGSVKVEKQTTVQVGNQTFSVVLSVVGKEIQVVCMDLDDVLAEYKIEAFPNSVKAKEYLAKFNIPLDEKLTKMFAELEIFLPQGTKASAPAPETAPKKGKKTPPAKIEPEVKKEPEAKKEPKLAKKEPKKTAEPKPVIEPVPDLPLSPPSVSFPAKKEPSAVAPEVESLFEDEPTPAPVKASPPVKAEPPKVEAPAPKKEVPAPKVEKETTPLVSLPANLKFPEVTADRLNAFIEELKKKGALSEPPKASDGGKSLSRFGFEEQSDAKSTQTHFNRYFEPEK